ncbi:hypothetical protein ACFHYN_00050 [Pasteurella multocida]|uniref:hypothetical protein n=1 Tax=Pasteurella multocida TaxID=747 RepID=UPI0032F64AB4|nr:hypothetical protein [Pasteurella multocida]HDR1168255.1 hypothetical protein [Pasteurella multocida]HDR1174522.1 hypothetical protein [Pasteurella multocida]
MSNFIEIIEDEESVDVGDVRAIEYEEAVDWGLEPESYKRNIPIGSHTVKLIFKTWGKKCALNCFFKDIQTEDKYRITLFTSAKDPYRYTAKDNFIDFSESGNLENIYQIEVKHSPKDYPIMLSANLLQEIRRRSYSEYIASLTKKC